ncbi:hypothetical protein [Lysobacter sp. Hz 25]|uniref:hypothetical protein n=1 Tax=Lysobacter sp. Hz 25 TaxID=3383698 RepID=UPI0038D39094
METIFAFLTVVAVLVAAIYTLVWSFLWYVVIASRGAAAPLVGATRAHAYWAPFAAWSWLAVRFFA